MIERSDDGGQTWKPSSFGEICEKVMETYESRQALRTALIKIKRGEYIGTVHSVFRYRKPTTQEEIRHARPQ
jgi:hypothetical protein